jgi:hypothetical protein
VGAKFAALTTALQEILAVDGLNLAGREWPRPLGEGLHEFRIRRDAATIRRMSGASRGEASATGLQGALACVRPLLQQPSDSPAGWLRQAPRSQRAAPISSAFAAWPTRSYIVLGWAAVVALPVVVASIPASGLALMVTGGIAYTAGGGGGFSEAGVIRDPTCSASTRSGTHAPVIGTVSHFAMVWLISA